MIYHLSIQVYIDSKPYLRSDIGTYPEVSGDVYEKKFFFVVYTIYQLKTHFLVKEILKKYTNGDVLIRMNLIINYELKSLILSYGIGLIVKKPLSLREELLKNIELIRNNYLV